MNDGAERAVTVDRAEVHAKAPVPRELAVVVPYAGLTPHKWHAVFDPNRVRLAGQRRRASSSQAAGAGGSEYFLLEFSGSAPTVIRFELRGLDGRTVEARSLVVGD